MQRQPPIGFSWQGDLGQVSLQRPLSTVLLTTNNPPTFWRTDFAAIFEISALFKSYDAQIAADRPSSGLKYYNYGRRIFSAYPD